MTTFDVTTPWIDPGPPLDVDLFLRRAARRAFTAAQLATITTDPDESPIKPGCTIVMHPHDFAELLGLRRTRVGRWVWRGRTYRTRALALRRMPVRVTMHGTPISRSLGTDRGKAYVLYPLPKFNPLCWEPLGVGWEAT